jgi:PIF1-like helicase/Helix-turn-helix domain/Helicase
MLQTDEANVVFKLAADFVHQTSRPIFLTGKAGTGKTTFLKHIREQTTKKVVVVAPTGVAAINAGGVTMHSFFQLPFGPFIPGTRKGFSERANNSADKHSLFENIRFNADKRQLLQELELLIIDEVSMVRADMLDAMDLILRHFRKKLHVAFGGVQVVYIGDMYQLPPVVPNDEWDILQAYYESPFFFSAKAIAEAPPLYIELKKIYRQNEQLFIDVLNRVRNNQLTEDDYALLNSRYQPNFTVPEGEKYVTLCTHNRSADTINNWALQQLPGKIREFNGVIEGDFSEKALPTDNCLQLKEGAQVMFIKNDSGTDRKYFNGKLATIKTIDNDEITVTDNSNNEELKVEKETWRNLRYNYNKETDRIDEEELGSFTQYPLRLAWAITIHKSQGLTFDKAIIDAGASFAPGQVYVALSRCTSLHGMILLSQLHPSAIATDKRVIAFAQKEAAAEELERLLAGARRQYWAETLLKIFDYSKTMDLVNRFAALVPGKKLPDNDAALSLATTLVEKAGAQLVVADKFRVQLQQLLDQVAATGNTAALEDRAGKGITYFIQQMGEQLILPLQQHHASLQQAARVKKYIKEVSGITQLLQHQLNSMATASYGSLVFCKDPAVYKKYVIADRQPEPEPAQPKSNSMKGGSQLETLALFKKGNSIAAIASLRQLTEGTIGGHLAMFIRTGELDIHELLPAEKIQTILPVVREIGGHAITPIKEILGDNFTYAEIRMVLNYWHLLQEEKTDT